eukprot:CAMPEP_0197397824 /NCGR_PEP_ID=MMETSP1165-20131217/12185_1 /TAXON_ID=284809 /ORGANISM="Chrysocystis fragilis, Strain CCMP3189" /LENGTH=107 /DNA_ID=CAMNT_0042923741 /DNA_START=58 /DNA_END=377 /DNA_ORIENTATION=+
MNKGGGLAAPARDRPERPAGSERRRRVVRRGSSGRLASYSFLRLELDDAVPAKDDHANRNFVAVPKLLCGVVEDEVEELVVAAEDAVDAAVPVEPDREELVHVLLQV